MAEQSKNIPQHLGIIMDGNRRYAKALGLPSFEGHRAGYETLKNVGDWCLDIGIRYITVYGFSTENWKRSETEVAYLMELFHKAVTEELSTFQKKGIQLRIIGEKRGLPEKLIQAFADAEMATEKNARGVLSLAINYGGRLEIMDAVKEMMREGKKPEEVTEELLADHLWTKGIPDPDLIVRTSGEQRLSNFLPWQSAYSEIYFEEKTWPALTRADFDRIIEWYANRERRFGK